jgi:hypothetical protein
MEFNTTGESSSGSRPATRKSQTHAVLGSPAELPANVLPTTSKVVRYFVQLKEKRKTGNATVIHKVADDVIQLWRTASIPTVEWQTVAKRIRKLVDTGGRLNRSKTSTS